MIAYLIKVVLCSGLFIITYKLLLEKEKMLRFNRAYLLSAVLLSFCIPALTYRTFGTALPEIQEFLVTTNISPAVDPIQNSTMIVRPGASIVVLITAYIGISAMLLFRFVLNITKILSTVSTRFKIPYRTSRLVLVPGNLATYSFLQYIFVNETEFQAGKIENEILVHELCHVDQKHSYDMIFIEFLLTVSWFNPFLYLFKTSLQLNHEFLADEAVTQDYSSIAGYQKLLIAKSIQSKTPYITSQFNYLTTKRRLIMMTKQKSFTNTLIKQIFLIPILALSVLIFSTNTIAQQSSPVQQHKQKEAPSTQGGATAEQLRTYEAIVNKANNAKGIPVYDKFTEDDILRLQTIYFAMSKDQQDKQMIVFAPAPPPMRRTVPTKDQLESWKNPKVYGVWINDKRINNDELNNFSDTSFAHFFLSKLAKNAINYGKHYYQVNLMTGDKYVIYLHNAVKNQKKYLMFYRTGNVRYPLFQGVKIDS